MYCSVLRALYCVRLIHIPQFPPSALCEMETRPTKLLSDLATKYSPTVKLNNAKVHCMTSYACMVMPYSCFNFCGFGHVLTRIDVFLNPKPFKYVA